MSQTTNSLSKSSVYVIFLLVVLVWGTAWPINKVGLYHIPAVWYPVFRILIGTVTIFIFLGLTKKLAWPTRADIPHILSVGLLLVGLFQILVNIGLSMVPAGRSTILIYTTQIWVIPISYLFFKERISGYHLLSLLLGLVGIFILFSPLGMPWHNHTIVVGNIVLLLSAVTWAINMVINRYLPWHHSPLTLLPWQLLMGLIPILITALVSAPHPNIDWNYVLVGSLLYTGILGTAFGLWGMIVVSKELPLATSSLSLLAIPMLSIITSRLFLGEPITKTMLLAMIFIFFGLLLIIIDNKNTSKIHNKIIKD